MRPIPINKVGLRDRHPSARGIAWSTDIAQNATAPPGLDAAQRALLFRQVLLLISGIAGGAAVISALGGWSEIAVSRLGLERRWLFYLLATGVYLAATTFYAAWKSRLLQDLNQAPGDVRLMAYMNMAVGGCIVLVVGIGVLAVIAILMTLARLAAWMSSQAAHQLED